MSTTVMAKSSPAGQIVLKNMKMVRRLIGALFCGSPVEFENYLLRAMTAHAQGWIQIFEREVLAGFSRIMW